MTPDHKTGTAMGVRGRLSIWHVLLAYGQLAKIHLVGMILVSSCLGLLLAGGGHVAWVRVGWALFGTALAAAGACALNQYQDREADGRMERTRHRPLPAGRLTPAHALVFGSLLVLAGSTVLAARINLLTACLGLLTTGLYVLVYSPLKQRTWLNTPLGALAGAIPSLMGWTAVAGRLAAGGWLLFVMVFLWQHVHFYTIAWLHRDDYRKAGYVMLPVVDGDGRRTFRQLVFAAAALLPVSLLLAALGLAGPAYVFGAVLAGALMLAAGLALARARSLVAAHALLRLALVYLPFLLGMVAWDCCR